jgi:hypothetical protein
MCRHDSVLSALFYWVLRVFTSFVPQVHHGAKFCLPQIADLKRNLENESFTERPPDIGIAVPEVVRARQVTQLTSDGDASHWL